MPDRRQSDRRESGEKAKKEIKISLGTFIMTIVFFLLIIAGVLFCRYFYNLGHKNGSIDAYAEGYQDAYEELAGYDYDGTIEYSYEE